MRNARLRTIIGFLVFASGAVVHAQTPPSADRVFRLHVTPGTAGALELSWTIAPGNYLYHDKIAATGAGGSAIELRTDPGEIKDDPSFGQTEIYRDRAHAVVAAKLLPRDGDIVVIFQGCAERGICYPPVKKTVDPRTMSVVGDSAVKSELAGSSAREPVQGTKAEASFAPLGALAGPAPEPAGLQGNIVAVLLAFTGFGSLLAFTPCVFPMIPILSGMLARSGDRLTAWRGFVLSGTYVLAMALAHAILGVVAAWSGQNLQAALQTPAVLASTSAVFLALAVSMFGYYDLQIPQSWQTRLIGKASPRGGSLAGAAIMGFGSALIVGPCVTPPLAAALVYVAQTGDILRGASALFALGVGMGLPLLVFGTFGGGILPKSGPWLAHVKRLFGFVFVGLAISIASRILPDRVVAILWAAMAGSVAAYLVALIAVKHDRRPHYVLAAATGVLIAIVVLVAVSFDDSFRLPPGFGDMSASGFVATARSLEFKTVSTPQALDEAFARARQDRRPVVLDFSAAWCVECHVMDRTVFSDRVVRERLRDFDLIRADATDYNGDSQSLMKRFGVVGPPTVIFLDAELGQEAADTRIIGAVDPATFLEHLDHLDHLPAG
ncbi:protein-disulfide reductase DsbD [Bradyrhizobium sp.]|uniref:protein-disulfide reductase DsbD n=1 Tax=Bradyrhizobium sp. TaxID=376 RepID=UPI003C3CB470